MTAAEKWSTAWTNDIHETDDAKKRIASAKSSKLTPIKIETADMHGYFQGSSGRYETFLDSCPCGDFRRTKKPCKHIYRLAMELGAFESDFTTNAAAIPAVRGEEASVSSTVDIVEGLSELAQLLLLEIAVHTKSDSPCYTVFSDELSEELLSSGIVKEDSRALKYKNAGELKRILDKLGLEYDKKAKAKELYEYCTANYKDSLGEFYPEVVTLYIDSHYNRRNIHYYLHRKYDSEFYIDEEGMVHDERLLDTELPDDKITDELIRRGYYNRDTI